jgi:hypothetical protein
MDSNFLYGIGLSLIRFYKRKCFGGDGACELNLGVYLPPKPITLIVYFGIPLGQC